MAIPDGVVIATVTISKLMAEDDIYISANASALDGELLPLVEVLGMIELGKDSLIRQAMDVE